MKLKSGAHVIFHVVVCLFAFLLFTRCTEENPVQPVPENPQIVLIQAPARVYQFPATPQGVHVRAEDPQGAADLAGVRLSIKPINRNVVYNVDMRDDGLNGDILARDGQYFLPMDTALVHSQTGDFILSALARDVSGLESSIASDTITILPGRENRLPQLLSVTAPNFIVTDSSYRPQLLAQASDPDGPNTVRSVRVEIYPPYFSKPAFVDSLLDDGRHGDGAANDGIFGQTLTPARFGCNAGVYSFVFRAVDLAASQSPAETKAIAISQRGGTNTPPLLTDLQAPANISRNATPNTYLLSVRATEPNAPCDGINRVFFNTFLPNGNPSSGNPFLMRDDGQQGDTVANDGRYSLTIQITPQNATGSYHFEFQAEDKRGAPSVKLIHTINVTD